MLTLITQELPGKIVYSNNRGIYTDILKYLNKPYSNKS